MYEEFLKAVLTYVAALNGAERVNAAMEADDSLIPYVAFVPVLLDDQICGFITDEIGGAYSYAQATEEQREWWDNRPFPRRVLA